MKCPECSKRVDDCSLSIVYHDKDGNHVEKHDHPNLGCVPGEPQQTKNKKDL